MKAKTTTTEHPIRAIRRAAVPLVAIETADPAATMQETVKALNGKADDSPICRHDMINGLQGLNEQGRAYAAEVSPGGAIESGNPVECLALLAKTPAKRALFFMCGAAREMEDGQGFNPGMIQALWNLRDPFKASGSTIVLLSPSFRMPPELSRDVVIVTEPLPNREELGRITDSICRDADLPKPEGPEREAIIDTLTGLGAFEAEQTLALSVLPGGKGIDRAGLWERKVRAIEALPGLTVYRGKEKRADVAGNGNALDLLGATITGPMQCSCIVFIDEVDKGMAAAGTDTSGTSQDQLKALLTYLQDNDAVGSSALGPPGTGKTLTAKALAGEHGIPLIMLDLGALKGSLVGQSEANMRAALKIIHAISDGRALWIVACNRDQGLPPELRRRFSFLTFYFDLPTRQEKDAAWKVHTTRLRFQGEPVTLREDQLDRTGIDDTGWTGAEIRNCCLKAYGMGTTLAQAAKSIVPVSKSAADQVLASRKAASGKYISAGRPGVYTYTEQTQDTTATAGRRIDAGKEG